MRLSFLSISALTLLGTVVAATPSIKAVAQEPPPAAVNQVDPRAVGVVIGGILGHRVAASLDPADRQMASDAEYHALEFGEPGTSTTWDNPVTHHRGVIVPEKPYAQGDGFCRAYTHTVDLGGAGETIREIACRRPNGTWLSGA